VWHTVVAAWTYFDPRVAVVAIALLVSVLITALFYWLNIGLNPGTHFGAVFASWVAGVALFVFVGIASALASLARPERGSFEERARILFRKQEGRHIDYIVNRLRHVFEHYAEAYEENHRLIEYREDAGRFYVSMETKTTVRSYIDDVETAFPTKLRFDDIIQPPSGGQPNMLKHLRIDGVARKSNVRFDRASFEHEESAFVRPHNTCQVEVSTAFWVQAGTEETSITPVRFTQRIRFRVENELSFPVRVRILSSVGALLEEFVVQPSSQSRWFEMQDLEPDRVAYDVRYERIDV
jgi:hypothetical protein